MGRGWGRWGANRRCSSLRGRVQRGALCPSSTGRARPNFGLSLASGKHGAWLVDVGPAEVAEEQLPIAYEETTLEVTGVETEENIETCVLQAVREDLAGQSEQWPGLTHGAYRLFDGRTQLRREIE